MSTRPSLSLIVLAVLFIFAPLAARAQAVPSDSSFLTPLRDCIRACPFASCTPERAGCVASCFSKAPVDQTLTYILAHPLPPLATPDTAPPRCTLVAQDGECVTVAVQDFKSGLSVIFPLVLQNADLPGEEIPPTLAIYEATACKIDEEQGARAVFAAVDACNNLTFCDPVTTRAVRGAGKPVAETFSDMSQEEAMISILNGSPGLQNLEVVVNGIQFRITGMGDGERTVLDVSRAMLPGDRNVFTLKSFGKPGSAASVLIADQALAQ